MSAELPYEPVDDDRPLPVLASETRVLERPRPLATPALVAAGGFVTGFVTFLLARVIRRGRSPIRLRRSRGLEISSSRSFLVDVHVLKR